MANVLFWNNIVTQNVNIMLTVHHTFFDFGKLRLSRSKRWFSSHFFFLFKLWSFSLM